MDETQVKVGGQWRYLYRPVDLDGDRGVIDFLLRAKWDHAAARAFFEGPSTCTACPRRSPSTRVAPTRRPSWVSRPTAAGPSRCANRNTATSSSSKTTAHQIDHSADARLQNLSPRPDPYRRHRGHAHDPQRPDRRNQRMSLACRAPVYSLAPRCPQPRCRVLPHRAIGQNRPQSLRRVNGVASGALRSERACRCR